MTRLTKRYIPSQSEEWEKIKTQIKEEYRLDLLALSKWHVKGAEYNICLIEDGETCVGFIVPDQIATRLWAGKYHGYSLISSTAIFRRSNALAYHWVKNIHKKRTEP